MIFKAVKLSPTLNQKSVSVNVEFPSDPKPLRRLTLFRRASWFKFFLYEFQSKLTYLEWVIKCVNFSLKVRLLFPSQFFSINNNKRQFWYNVASTRVSLFIITIMHTVALQQKSGHDPGRYYMRFKVLMAVKISSFAFWMEAVCSYKTLASVYMSTRSYI